MAIGWIFAWKTTAGFKWWQTFTRENILANKHNTTKLPQTQLQTFYLCPSCESERVSSELIHFTPGQQRPGISFQIINRNKTSEGRHFPIVARCHRKVHLPARLQNTHTETDIRSED